MPGRRPTGGQWPQNAGQPCARGSGATWTLRSLLEHLTGEDVLERVRTMLQRHLAAHLDLGVAAWRNPQRAQGFYAAWRASAGLDMAWELDELPNVRDDIAWLPDDPLDVLAEELARLVADEASVARLSRTAGAGTARLVGDVPVARAQPGAWRRHASRHARLPGRARAARTLLCEDLLRRLTGSPMSFAELHAWFAARPAEFLVRDALRRQSLDETLQHRAARLCAAGDHGRPDDAAWETLATALVDAAMTCVDDATARATRLQSLAARLGLVPGDLDALTPAAAAALLDCATSLDPLARGQVWLLAYERHYREQLFSALAANQSRSRPPPQTSAQVVFCMDDREEGTRRHLEELAPSVATYGAAGFFGVAT